MQHTLPWILASLSLVLLLTAGGLWLARNRPPKSRPLPTEWTLTARPVFSSDERRVYRHLREALPHHIVLSKLPLVRFSQPTDPNEVRFWYELLGSINVTFAVCSANGRVLAAIDTFYRRDCANVKHLPPGEMDRLVRSLCDPGVISDILEYADMDRPGTIIRRVLRNPALYPALGILFKKMVASYFK